MDHDLECGICLRRYNSGRRCPRDLPCKHTFCESCLVTVSRVQTLTRTQRERRVVPLRLITCPLCRGVTSFSKDLEKMKDELLVNESLLEKLKEQGVLDQEGDDGPEEAEDKSWRGRIRRAWKKVLRKVAAPESDDVELKETMLMVGYSLRMYWH